MRMDISCVRASALSMPMHIYRGPIDCQDRVVQLHPRKRGAFSADQF